VTMRELDQLECIEAVVQGDLKPKWAAERLGLTMRQVRRLSVRYRREGELGWCRGGVIEPRTASQRSACRIRAPAEKGLMLRVPGAR
jgi:hypothetical protein